PLCSLLLLLRSPASPLSSHTLLLLFFLLTPPPPRPTLFPYTTLFRSPSPPSSHSPGRAPRRLTHRSPSRSRSRFRCRCPRSRHRDRKSTRLNSSHDQISYAVFCLKKKKKKKHT